MEHIIVDLWQKVDEHSSFVGPVAEPVLSAFCKKLTSISTFTVRNRKEES